MFLNRPWWPSGLSRHVSISSRDRCSGPRFISPLGITILIFRNWKQYLANQTVGGKVTCVAYDTPIDSHFARGLNNKKA